MNQGPIQRREFIRRVALGSAAVMAGKYVAAQDSVNALPIPEPAAGGVIPEGADGLSRGFQSPADGAKPHCWWHWMDGNVTKEGITADLEAMKRAGLGGVHIFNIGYQIPSGPLRYMTPEWLEAMRFAAQEGQRLGLEVGMHNCSGWSSSGGPWVTPDKGMQKVVWSELRIKGPVKFHEVVPQAKLRDFGGYYHDIALLACRTPPDEGITVREAKPSISSSLAKDAGESVILDQRGLSFPAPIGAKPQFVLFHFPTPYTARSLFLEYTAGRGDTQCEVQISEDNQDFRTIASGYFSGKGQFSLSFSQFTSPYYRILFTGERDEDGPLHITGMDLLGGYRLPNWPAKAGFGPLDAFDPVWDDSTPTGSACLRDQMVDLSAAAKGDGMVEWDVPVGDWILFRFGYAPNGRPNTHPETPAGFGLEVDKMSRAALDLHFDNLIAAVLKEMGPLAGKTFTTLLIDSYEVGPQNWTPGFREEFQKRRGYDLLPYLPAFTGRLVDSAEITERFLWDVRRTIADLFADNYYGYFTELCHRRDLKAAFEAYVGPYSTLDCSALADLPMGEFWTGNGYRKSNARNRLVISAAHLNGRSVVGAEAFTSGFESDRFTQDPYSMKALGDFQFCEGINRFYFHDFTLQPWVDKAPGMTMGPWGLHFSRTVTWWEQGRSWMDYITRCQYLLQTGAPVADILCFTGEDAQAQSRWGKSNAPAIPEGYDFEFINVAGLLTAEVKDGRILLPNGQRFWALVLPDGQYLTPMVAQTIARLVTAGAVVIGPPPHRSPSLSNYPACDATIRGIAADLWGSGDGRSVTDQVVRRGRVCWGKSLEDVLNSLDLARDFAYRSSDGEARICFKHRTTESADIFFVSNQRERSVTIEGQFRIVGKVPELWHADTGSIEPAPIYQVAAGHINVPLQFDPAGSVFVIFRHPITADHAIVAKQRPPAQKTTPSARMPQFELNAKADELVLTAWNAGDYEITTASGRNLLAHIISLPEPVDLDDDWEVRFPPKLGAPASVHLAKLGSLSHHSDPGVRYFSGTAAYTKDFPITPQMLVATRDIFLDLGLVKNLAEVKINDTDFGILWKPPFRVNITSALRPGINRMEVQLTNLWGNRLIGDEQLPDDCEWIHVPDRGLRLKEWPKWLVDNKPRPSQRIAFATWKFYAKNDEPPVSGLLGPVKLYVVEKRSMLKPTASNLRAMGV